MEGPFVRSAQWYIDLRSYVTSLGHRSRQPIVVFTAPFCSTSSVLSFLIRYAEREYRKILLRVMTFSKYCPRKEVVYLIDPLDWKRRSFAFWGNELYFSDRIKEEVWSRPFLIELNLSTERTNIIPPGLMASVPHLDCKPAWITRNLANLQFNIQK